MWTPDGKWKFFAMNADGTNVHEVLQNMRNREYEADGYEVNDGD